jgi:ArsR family transcriptional regulator
MKLEDEFLEFYALMCRTISKPVRLKILDVIGEGKMNVGELQKELDITMTSLSNHLNELYRAGVLGKEKQGNFVYYYLTQPKLLEGIARMQDLIKDITTCRNVVKCE